MTSVCGVAFRIAQHTGCHLGPPHFGVFCTDSSVHERALCHKRVCESVVGDHVDAKVGQAKNFIERVSEGALHRMASALAQGSSQAHPHFMELVGVDAARAHERAVNIEGY